MRFMASSLSNLANMDMIKNPNDVEINVKIASAILNM